MATAFSISGGQAQNLTATLPNDATGTTVPASSEKRASRTRSYTKENPLVYEDMWDLWPYAFLNENGEPDGFNVELIRMVLGELNIPYVIKMKDKQDAFEDLRDGKSDLMLGLSAGYHDAYGLYSENPVTLFTQSVASPIDQPQDIKSFKDLGTHKVFVNDSSLCHHLMIDYGWGENAIPYKAVKLALQKVSTDGEGAVVWNTLSLKWLIHKYQIKNLQVTPINMPHGEYKFMSNDPVLLAKLDSVYSTLDSSDQLVNLRNKWFYPEHQKKSIPSWVWWTAFGIGLLVLLAGIYIMTYRQQMRKQEENIRKKRQSGEARQRYSTLFNIAMQGHIRFDKKGCITNMNKQACDMFGWEREATLRKKESFHKLLDLNEVEIEHADGYSCTKTYEINGEKRLYAIELKTFDDENGNLAGMFALCYDNTEMYRCTEERKQLTEEVENTQETLNNYFTKIESILQDGHLRIASYSPDSHTLAILHKMDEVQHLLTQTRCMTLVDEGERKKAMHIFDAMDGRTDKEMRFDLRTNISLHGNYPMHFRFSFIPLYQDGKVTEYFGLCQDITHQKSIDFQLLKEAKKVQEVENTKTGFINNMVQEIRTPMDSIVEASETLCPRLDNDKNCTSCDVILEHSNYLLHLIDNILYLSRLEAHMIEVTKQECDFVDTFTTYCVAGRMNNDSVTFTTESPYDQLVVNIDAQKVGNVIERVVKNAIQHTNAGFIRARYDYIGRQLMISIEDTEEGIPPQELEQLNATTPNVRTNRGLGIPICKELLAQMGGHLEINSEEGLGTTVWITLPCQATTIKRKKMI